MSLRSPLAYELPEETARIARAALPTGNPYLRLADTLGPIFRNPDFADLYPTEGQPAEDPAQLALVTVFQFAEGLTDRQAADAVRSRIDWKYALCLPLDDDGFDHSVLSEFRARLLAGAAELRLFETVLTCLKDQGLVTARGRQRTDSTHVLAAIQRLSRLECVGETLRHTLNVLAVAAPDWLRAGTPAGWFDRYGPRVQEYRLPKGQAARAALAAQIGADGRALLARLDDPAAPAGLGQLPAVAVLRQVWAQQYQAADDPTAPGGWRAAAALPAAAERIVSPYDAEARLSVKRETVWTGYRVHLTETCDAERPNLITDVATAPATEADSAVTAQIHARLDRRALLPGEHLVDAMYVTADHLVTSRTEHGLDLVGPVGADTSWQARQQTGYAVAQFAIDWDAQQARCPQGQASASWKPGPETEEHPSVTIRWAPADCGPCPARARCVSHAGARTVTVRAHPQYDALMAARQQQTSPAFKERYAQRAGVEGTISQGVQRTGLRRTRYIGLAKTALGHLFIATALNLIRVAAWLAETPRSVTRRSAFAALAPTPA